MVATVNVPVDCPAGTVTVGRVAASSTSELVSATAVPPAGAGPLSVTVQVAESPLPPAITDGLHVNAFAVCAWAVELKPRSRARSVRAVPPSRVVESVNRNLLSVCVGGTQGGTDSVECKPATPANEGNRAESSAVL